MKLVKLGIFLKTIIVGIAICGIAACAYVIPQTGKFIIKIYPELKSWFTPWLIFILSAAIPCFAALPFAWNIATQIKKDNSFSITNAKSLKAVSILAAADSVYFLIGNIVLWLFSYSHPSIVLLSLFAVFAGISIAVISASLSHLVLKAATIKDENDLTI